MGLRAGRPIGPTFSPTSWVRSRKTSTTRLTGSITADLVRNGASGLSATDHAEMARTDVMADRRYGSAGRWHTSVRRECTPRAPRTNTGITNMGYGEHG